MFLLKHSLLFPILTFLRVSISVGGGMMEDGFEGETGIVQEYNIPSNSKKNGQDQDNIPYYTQELSSSFKLSKDFALRFDEELGRGDGEISYDKLIELDHNMNEMAELLHFAPGESSIENNQQTSHIIPTEVTPAKPSPAIAENNAASPTTSQYQSHSDYDLPSGTKEDGSPKPSATKNIPEAPIHPARQRQNSPKLRTTIYSLI